MPGKVIGGLRIRRNSRRQINTICNAHKICQLKLLELWLLERQKNVLTFNDGNLLNEMVLKWGKKDKGFPMLNELQYFVKACPDNSETVDVNLQ